MKKENIGVIIGRMNPPHIEHVSLIKRSLIERKITFIFIGIQKKGNEKNPFCFLEIKTLFHCVFEKEIIKGNLFIDNIQDIESDKKWTQNLFKKIKKNSGIKNITFYGGDFKQDSAIFCIQKYQNLFSTYTINFIEEDRYKKTILYKGKRIPISSTILRYFLQKNNKQLVNQIVEKNMATLLWEIYYFSFNEKKIKKDIDIKHLSHFKTSAYTRYYFEINNTTDVYLLVYIIKYTKKIGFPILFIGSGSNMLFAFDLYEGIVIKNNLYGWSYDEKIQLLESYSNEPIWNIAEQLEKKYNQYIWHRFIGLPGSVGGAIFGNAGCFGLEIENNFLEIDVFDLENGQVSTLSKKQMSFSYRNSILKQKEGKYFIIKARFDLSVIYEKYSSQVDNISYRKYKQPKGNTCGSFFKNPSQENTAGKLIEKVGLKGYKIGGAFFSEKHANFLMNDGTGTYKDLLELIELAKSKVRKEFGIELVNEVRIIFNSELYF